MKGFRKILGRDARATLLLAALLAPALAPTHAEAEPLSAAVERVCAERTAALVGEAESLLAGKLEPFIAEERLAAIAAELGDVGTRDAYPLLQKLAGREPRAMVLDESFRLPREVPAHDYRPAARAAIHRIAEREAYETIWFSHRTGAGIAAWPGMAGPAPVAAFSGRLIATRELGRPLGPSLRMFMLPAGESELPYARVLIREARLAGEKELLRRMMLGEAEHENASPGIWGHHIWGQEKAVREAAAQAWAAAEPRPTIDEIRAAFAEAAGGIGATLLMNAPASAPGAYAFGRENWAHDRWHAEAATLSWNSDRLAAQRDARAVLVDVADRPKAEVLAAIHILMLPDADDSENRAAIDAFLASGGREDLDPIREEVGRWLAD